MCLWLVDKLSTDPVYNFVDYLGAWGAKPHGLYPFVSLASF
jgi:hypothetical protein